MTLTESQWIALLPLLLSCATAVAVMLAIAWRRDHFANATVCVIGINAALLSLIPVLRNGSQIVTDLMIVDNYACLYMGLILVSTLACCTLAHAYMEGYTANKEELYLLFVTSACGGLVLVCANHLASFFIGLELMSVPMYGLIAYAFLAKRSLEAGLKYLVLSATASAFLLFGMALLYADTGTLAFGELGQRIGSMGSISPMIALGSGMMLVGIAFKLSLVPFHAWTPDIYEGAPAPVAAFIASVGKVAVFAVLLRFLVQVPSLHTSIFSDLLAGLAIASIVVGNLLALRQSNIKRLIGYSSIAHFGYLVIAIVAMGHIALEAIGMYLITYVVSALGAFGVVTLVSSPFKGRDADGLFDYRGLFWKRPYLTSVLTVMMLSLAGIPMTAGFIGKFYIAAAGVESGHWGLLAALVVGSAIGIFYYLRVMVTLFLAEPNMRRYDARPNWGQRTGGWMVMVLIAVTLWLGVYPQPVIELVRSATMG